MDIIHICIYIYTYVYIYNILYIYICQSNCWASHFKGIAAELETLTKKHWSELVLWIRILSHPPPVFPCQVSWVPSLPAKVSLILSIWPSICTSKVILDLARLHPDAVTSGTILTASLWGWQGCIYFKRFSKGTKKHHPFRMFQLKRNILYI